MNSQVWSYYAVQYYIKIQEALTVDGCTTRVKTGRSYQVQKNP